MVPKVGAGHMSFASKLVYAPSSKSIRPRLSRFHYVQAPSGILLPHHKKSIRQQMPATFFGAEGGSRTHTLLRELPSEDSESANSSTSAYK